MSSKQAKAWVTESVSSLNKSGKYGKVGQAYRHRTGILLVKERWRARQSRDEKKMGSWAVYREGKLVERKSFYYPVGKPKPPLKWAIEVVGKND